MNPIIRKIMSLRKGDKINGGENVLPIRKINPLEKSRMEHKKMQELQNKIIGQRNNIGLTKGFAHDTRKRQFIKKGILGIIMGIGIAVFSKIANARYFFADGTSQSAAAVVPSQADQAALEAETNEDTYVPPDLIKHSPGVAKAWGVVTAAGANRSPVYNLDANGDTGTGDRLIQFTVAFSSTVYAGSAQVAGDDANQVFALLTFPGSVDEIRCTTRQATDPGTSTTTLTDHGVAVAFFGDQ